MNLLIKRTAPVLALLGLGLAGCQPTIEAPKSSAGQADFSRYIAVGNSLTAGFSIVGWQPARLRPSRASAGAVRLIIGFISGRG